MLIRCAFDWQSGGCAGDDFVFCWLRAAAETVVGRAMQLRERAATRGVCAVHVIRNYAAAAAGHLVVLSAACICCLLYIYSTASRNGARANRARPPNHFTTAERQLANFGSGCCRTLWGLQKRFSSISIYWP